MRKYVATAAVAACVAVPTMFGLLGVRSKDLEEITQRNCAAINQLVTKRNEAAVKGRAIAESLFVQSRQGQPEQTPAQRKRTEQFLDSLYYKLEPIEC